MADEPRFYYPDGRLCPEIPARKGGMKAPTVADARELGLVPSVTTILGIIRKPGLEQWMLNTTKDEAEAARVAGADYGKRLHAAVSGWLSGHPDSDPELEAVMQKVGEFWTKQGWMARETERSFAMSDYGGTVDLIAIDRVTERLVIADWKTQKTNGRANFYPEWGLQLAAYAHGMGVLGDCQLMSVVISTTEDMIVTQEWSDGERYLRDFNSAKDLWYSTVGPGKDLRTERVMA